MPWIIFEKEGCKETVGDYIVLRYFHTDKRGSKSIYNATSDTFFNSFFSSYDFYSFKQTKNLNIEINSKRNIVFVVYFSLSLFGET